MNIHIWRNNLQYVIGALCGLAVGCLLGYLKNAIVWNRYIKKGSEEGYSNETAQVYGRLLASNVLNIVILVVVFLLGNIVPIEKISLLIGAATGLVAINLITAGLRK